MNSLAKVSLRNGVLAGIIGSGLLIGLYHMGRHPFLIPLFLDFRIMLFSVFIFFTLKELRDYHNGGMLSFWEGMLSSLLFTLAFAAIALLVLQIFISTTPAFLQEYITLKIQELKTWPAEEIEKGKSIYEYSLEQLPRTTAWDIAFQYFLQSFPISLFISIILSVTLRRQPKT